MKLCVSTHLRIIHPSCRVDNPDATVMVPFMVGFSGAFLLLQPSYPVALSNCYEPNTPFHCSTTFSCRPRTTEGQTNFGRSRPICNCEALLLCQIISRPDSRRPSNLVPSQSPNALVMCNKFRYGLASGDG